MCTPFSRAGHRTTSDRRRHWMISQESPRTALGSFLSRLTERLKDRHSRFPTVPWYRACPGTRDGCGTENSAGADRAVLHTSGVWWRGESPFPYSPCTGRGPSSPSGRRPERRLSSVRRGRGRTNTPAGSVILRTRASSGRLSGPLQRSRWGRRGNGRSCRGRPPRNRDRGAAD